MGRRNPHAEQRRFSNFKKPPLREAFGTEAVPGVTGKNESLLIGAKFLCYMYLAALW